MIKKSDKKNQRTNPNEGRLFMNELANVRCNSCKDDLDVAMIINFGFNSRKDEEPKGVTLHKVTCKKCKIETPYYSNTDKQAVEAWNQFQKNQFGNNAE